MKPIKLITENNRKWWVFVATALAVMMVDIDITAVNLALATIARELNVGLSTAQWIIDGYMIAAASLMALGGRLSEIFTGRRVFLFGLGLFAIASFAVGFSTGTWSIISSRILQGACIAFTFPVAIILVRQIFPVEKQGFVIGLMVAIAGLSQALGPTIGGVIIHVLSWRWIFFLNVPLALFAFVVASYALPKVKIPSATYSLHMKGVMALVLGLFGIMTALNEVLRWGVNSIQFIGLLSIGFVLLIVFIFIEFKSRNPLLELRLLINRNFLIISNSR